MKLTPLRPVLTPSTRGLEAFHQSPEQLVWWKLAEESMRSIREAVSEQRFCKITPGHSLTESWPYLNKRFTEVI